MNRYIRIKETLPLLAIILLVMISCKEDDVFPELERTTVPMTMAEALADDGNFSSLFSGLDQVGLDSALSTATNHLMFAPINAAFADVDISTMSVTELELILLNHLQTTTTAGFTDNLETGYIPTLASGPDETSVSMYINKGEDGTIVLNGISTIVEAQQNIGTTNGVIQGVDAILTPPTVIDHLLANPDYSMVAAAIEEAGLNTTLSGDGPFTIFAPTNLAFEEFLMTTNTLFGWATVADIPAATLEEVLTYHVVSGENVISAEVDGINPTSLQGSSFSVAGTSIDDPSETDANIVATDIQAVNGIVHGIDKVLITEDVYQSVLSASLNFIERLENRGFSNFQSAIDLVGLTDSLSSADITVFAPNNDAFVALFVAATNFESLNDFDTDEEIAALKSLILYHVYSGSLLESQLVDGENLTTATGEEIAVDLSGDFPRLTPTLPDVIPSRILTTNIGSTNGVIHEIDRVLIPESLASALGIETGGDDGLHPVGDPELVFFDWDGKDHWWGNVVVENDASISLDGSNYGRLNIQTGGTGWVDLFWRNSGTMNGADVVGSDLSNYSLKFDINVLEPISEGTFKIRFNNSNSGVDAFYDWAPWTETGEPFETDGWITVEIPLALIGQPDFTGLDQEFGMAFQDADVTLNLAIDNVRFDSPGNGGPDPVADEELVFFDWDGKDHWWGNAVVENDPSITLDGSNYGRLNFQTGGTGWQDLFWRNSGSLNGADVVGSNINDYALKFDINVLEPISEGTFNIRFNNTNSGVDSFYSWAPWNDTGEPYETNGWTTVTIPLALMAQTDYTGLDQEFGMAFQDADILLNVAIDNVRFEEL